MAQIRFSREMGITRREFLRTLPSAVDGRSLTIEGDRIIMAEPGRRIAIDLSNEYERKIAALRIPTTQVDFTFLGYSAQEVDEFMRRFDLSFRRGGG